MSDREKKALRRLRNAMQACRGEDFILDGLSVERPRELASWARLTREDWSKYKGREAVDARVVLDELAAAAQGYADVHGRAEQERARQAQKAER